MNGPLTHAEIYQLIDGDLADPEPTRSIFVIAYSLAAFGGAVVGFAVGLGIGAGWL